MQSLLISVMAAGMVTALSRRHLFHINIGISNLSMFHLHYFFRFLSLVFCVQIYQFVCLGRLGCSFVLLTCVLAFSRTRNGENN
jgi:hypothetical protein